jgi:hypothetical protein
MEVVRDVLFRGAQRVPEVGQISVSGMVEANGASVKVVGKVHKVVPTFVRPMEEARDVNGV